jgi:KDO2-lipid IV(A) lauroyltransferase
MTLVESCLMLLRTPAVLARRVTIDGLEHVTRALAESPNGILALSAHLGNWEVLSVVGMVTGLPTATVVRPLDSVLLDRFAERLRASTGVEVIRKRQAFRAVVEALRRGRVVAILLDQNASRAEGVFVPFFGRAASTSRSLALLSLRTHAPIVPVFVHREADGRHRIVVEPPLARPAAGSVQADVRELTAECARRVEAAVRRWPDQWLWLHRRWRTRPAGGRTPA